jgi:maltooligosyltrehalose trehalohydrolase
LKLGQIDLGTRPFGAVPLDEARVAFRVWGPHAGLIAVRVGETLHELARDGDGVWAAELPAVPGEDYVYVLDGGGALPDPCSRFQPEGVRGASRVVDPGAFPWTDAGWDGLRLENLVVYELHVGTFTPEGTFDAVIPRLRELRELGATAIELMPVATFPGNRGWGYDGVYVYAPHPTYGGPEGLARLVDAAHAVGLGVILDVVYNHIGPGSEAVAAFGPYFTDRWETPWGQALNYAENGVREWAIQNACAWVRDYHMDGLRLDAVFAIHDEGARHVLAELAERVHALNPRALVISETLSDDARPLEEWGHDAKWWDAFHHALHALLTGERDGYYEAFGRVEQLARAFERPEGPRLVVYAQNHDQIGNRAFGDRLTREQLRVAAHCVLFAPFAPLLFMGEEYGERRPFQFFSDHIDPAIADATRAGRQQEFAGFAGFGAEDVPDPQDPATFARSKLAPERGDVELRERYRELLRLRRELSSADVLTEFSEEEKRLLVRRGPFELHVDFNGPHAELRRR